MNIAVGVERIGGCEYVRTLLPYHELARRGHRVVWSDRIIGQDGFGLPVGTILAKDVRGNVYALADADVFVVQRVTDRKILDACRELQARGRTKIVYEFDDNFHAMPAHNPHAKDHGPTKEPTRVLDEFVAMADLVTVSTDGLRDEFARLRGGKPIYVCPNALEDATFARFARTYDGSPKREGETRIGWAGSGTHLGDLQMVLSALCSIMDEFPQVKIVFVGADMRGVMPERFYRKEMRSNAFMVKRSAENARVEFAGQTYATGSFDLTDLINPGIAPVKYYDLIDAADFDIAIAPIEANTFNRCKSWIKALEYGMLSVPMVLSNFGPYRDFARGASSVTPIAALADSRRDWYQLLRMLVTSAAHRAELGNAARRHIERHHLISSGADAWENALHAISREAVPA